MKTNRYAIMVTWFMVAVGKGERIDLSFVFGGKATRKRYLNQKEKFLRGKSVACECGDH